MATVEWEAEPSREDIWSNVQISTIFFALLLSLVFVVATRWPVMRMRPVEFDELNYLEINRTYLLPPQHTLFLASSRILGSLVGDPYEGFVIVDMFVSALALVSAWWWLRALVRPSTALAATFMLSVSPLFWSYGAMAGNYTAIIFVGSFLLGIAIRTRREPRPWHPFAAAVVLALGTGYRSDIGTLWLPLFFVILWQHRWRRAIAATALFTVLNLAWIVPMVINVGGWEAYSKLNREFAYRCGYLNSFWNLGFVNAPVRYSVKALMALIWTFGPGLLFVPRGLVRLARGRDGLYRVALLILCCLPALGTHLFVHFGVPGYSFHYVPTLLALIVLGIAPRPAEGDVEVEGRPFSLNSAGLRLNALAVALAAAFLFYPTNYDQPGIRGDFDLAFARHTRAGLASPLSHRSPKAWRTSNSINEYHPLPQDQVPGASLRAN